MNQAEQAHEPVRMCVVCRERFLKEELSRYVRPEDASKLDNNLVYDPDKTTPGRGYYVCGQARCRERFPKLVMSLMKKRRGD